MAHLTIFAMLTRMMSDYKVETINDGLNEFNVEFHGPKESTAFTLPLFYYIVLVSLLFLFLCFRLKSQKQDNLLDRSS